MLSVSTNAKFEVRRLFPKKKKKKKLLIPNSKGFAGFIFVSFNVILSHHDQLLIMPTSAAMKSFIPFLNVLCYATLAFDRALGFSMGFLVSLLGYFEVV